MVVITDTKGMMLQEPLPLLFAVHTEKDIRFQIYPYGTGDLLLRDIDSEHHGERVLVIPSRSSSSSPELANTVWEHFKSKLHDPMTYLVHGWGIDLDSSERYVVYSPLYERGQQRLREQGVSCMVRPEDMFFSQVDRDGYKGLRFRRI